MARRTISKSQLAKNDISSFFYDFKVLTLAIYFTVSFLSSLRE